MKSQSRRRVGEKVLGGRESKNMPLLAAPQLLCLCLKAILAFNEAWRQGGCGGEWGGEGEATAAGAGLARTLTRCGLSPF